MKNLDEGIMPTKNGEEKVIIIYKRDVDYTKDPYQKVQDNKNADS